MKECYDCGKKFYPVQGTLKGIMLCKKCIAKRKAKEKGA